MGVGTPSQLKKKIKAAISRVNQTLGIYEAEYISAQRTSDTEKEVCHSLQEFVEIRFNKECENIPEFEQLVIETEGHLFFCQPLEEPNEVTRRFKKATLVMLDADQVEDVTDELREKLEKLKKTLGGTAIEFNSVKKKIKYKIKLL